MTVRQLHLLGSPVLRQRAPAVARVDDAVRRLVDDLFETMRAAKGVGLAAPQVGASQRVAVQVASVAAAQEDVRVQQQRYNIGASTLLDLITSQVALATAEQALIQARYDYRIARAQLEALIGRDLQ